MAELERRAAAAAPARVQREEQTDIDQIPALVSKLGDDVMTLVDAKIGLLKVELKEEAGVYARTGGVLAAGGVIAAIGFTFLNIAVAFLFARLFFGSFTPPISYALGFLVTGVLYLVVGGLIAMSMKKRLATHSAAPQRTIDELRKDKQWLKNEI